MEPNKLDNEFRAKLEQRTIQPGPMAWDRLDAMLSVTEEKRKPKRTWMYVAASFLGFLLVGTLFLKQGSADNGSDIIKDNTSTVVNSPAPEAKDEIPVTGSAPGPVSVQQEQVYKGQRQVAATDNRATAKTAGKQLGTVDNNAVISSTPNEGVAIVEKQQDQENVIKGNDADKLLAESLAQNDAPAKKKSLKVDSNSLLSSVEGELDQSFKEKALQGAVKNFNAIKTSVANRNHK